ncbi:MAG: hypothetical protein HZC29_03865, partial [Thaumarchaeota archaeon]|nr:hypothetical protein [Nitrososphaerota archaeon]
DDWSGIWVNGLAIYSGWWQNSDTNGNWKYYFALNENLSSRLYVKDSSNNDATVTVNNVQYSTPSTSCWDEYCRTYNTATYSIVNSSNNQITGSGIISIAKPSSNWSRGYIYIKATVNGSGGTATIPGGYVHTKDFTAPNMTITAPVLTGTYNISNQPALWMNWTTTEDANCWLDIVSYDKFNREW